MGTTLTKESLAGLSQSELDQNLIEACSIGLLDDVKYLLTSPELKRHANIKGWDEEGFVCACRSENLELVDYMLRSKELKEHSDIHTWSDAVFKEACNRKDVQLLNYFIFDYKIEKTEEISNHIEAKQLTQIAKAFESGNKADKLKKADFPKKPKYR